MAVDKNSKAYQSLQNSGYTDEQINQMHQQTSEGQSAKDVIANTPAANKNENQQSQTIMVDPIAYRPEYNNGKYDKYIEGRDPTKLNNADINLSQYGDDSSAKNYNNSALWGGENQKYTGENTLGSQIAYNPNATLSGLDPNYLYGQAAQMQNSQDANYIARRNDEIASALYNEGKTSVQDVANFLSQQKQWDYSNENERQNTIMSVWKRIGQIAEQNGNKEPENPEEPETNDPLENMKSDLLKSTAGELYGKVTADQDTHIRTLEDENSVYKAMNESRIASFKQLQGMSSDSIAASIVSGVMATDTQSMRDLMQYDPAKYQEVKQAEKKLRGQMNINTITSGEGEWNTSATNGQSGLSNEITDFAINNSNSSTSTADILRSVNSTLSSNVSASSAQEQMGTIEADMATLQNRMKNLKREANQVFKGDVPQYIVNAYVANRTQEIQDQLSILENRYNAAYSRYQDEVKNAQWQMEFGLKQQELQLKKDAAALDDWATRQGIAIDRAKLSSTTTSTSTTINGKTVQTTSLSRNEISTTVDDLVEKCKNGQLPNAQCAAGIQKYYLPTLGVNLGTLSKRSEKQGICNELAGEYTPQKGDIVVMSSSSKPENGHMGIILGFRGEDIVYLDWNGELGANKEGTEEPKIRQMNVNNSKIYGYYNPTKNTIPQQETKWTTRYGKQYDFGQYADWNKLSNEEKEIVKGILEYRIDPTSLAKSGTDNGKANTRIRAAALAIGGQDFDYQEDEYKHRYDLVKKWNNATQAGGELSRNATAADELMRLYNIYHKYNQSNIVPLNWIGTQGAKIVGMAGPEEFSAALQVAASELAGALKGNASPSEQELKEYKNALAIYLSPAQFDSKIKEYLHGINNKMASEAQYYEKITGKKPQNIYNQFEGLPQFVSDVAGIDLSNYFSDIPASMGTTKRTTSASTGPNTSRGNTEQSGSGLTAEQKAARTQGATM